MRLSTCAKAGLRVQTFQSTHPLRGATVAVIPSAFRVGISIHAPLAGCDPAAYCRDGVKRYFNPRTPCGVRRNMYDRVAYADNFNPRTPCGVRRSADRVHFPPGLTFQSTHPLRGATLSGGRRDIPGAISIHAPLAGCDSKNTQKIFCIFAITDNKSRKDNVQRRLSERFPYKTGSIYLQK